MKPNMGTIDRAIRGLLAVIVAILYFTGVISGIVAIILGVIAVIFVVTGFMSYCPIYAPFGFSTAPKEEPTS